MPLFVPITKVDVAKRLVYGTLSEEVPDKSGEILDYESAKPAFMEWSQQSRQASGGKSLGNVRAMHSNIAAGKLTDLSFDDEGKRVEGVAKIVDDDEWQKVLEGVYTGFSIGGGYARRWPDAVQPGLMRYTPTLSEVSLVDNPAVPTATFEVVKQDGSVELRKFNPSKEVTVKPAASAASPSASEPQDDATHIAWLLKQLAWLENMLAEEGDEEMLSHVYALQDYLDEDSGAEFPAPDDDDDTSAHAFAGELAHFATRGRIITRGAPQEPGTQLTAVIETLQKRVAQLEAQPMPAKGALRAVGKSDDRARAEESLARLTPAERARELMKIALANPVEM